MVERLLLITGVTEGGRVRGVDVFLHFLRLELLKAIAILIIAIAVLSESAERSDRNKNLRQPSEVNYFLISTEY